MSKEQTSEGTNSESSGKTWATHHKSRETTMPEDPEDTLISSEGSRTSSKDHQAQTKEEEDLSVSKEGKR